MREIFCLKLQKKATGLDRAPIPGPLGETIYQHISQEAWALWQEEQIKFINEYRLNGSDPKSRQFLKDEMKKFLGL